VFSLELWLLLKVPRVLLLQVVVVGVLHLLVAKQLSAWNDIKVYEKLLLWPEDYILCHTVAMFVVDPRSRKYLLSFYCILIVFECSEFCKLRPWKVYAKSCHTLMVLGSKL